MKRNHRFILGFAGVALMLACSSTPASSDTPGAGASSGSSGGGQGGATGSGGSSGSNAKTGSGQAELCWDANGENDLAGYRIYFGTAPAAYDTSTPLGLTQTPAAPCTTVTDLAPGTYYFAVTAYDASGNESVYSNEASKTVL
jgi:hypothetical protein